MRPATRSVGDWYKIATYLESCARSCRDRWRSEFAYSFYLQYNIYTAENPLEHVVSVASHHHRVLHLRVSEYVCPSGR